MGVLVFPVLVCGSADERLFSLADMLSMESITSETGEYFVPEYSPFGDAIAFTKTRCEQDGGQSFMLNNLGGREKGDVYVKTSDSLVRRITDGKKENAGYFLQYNSSFSNWSPDGAHLLVIRAGIEGISLCVWNKNTGQLSVLCDGPLDYVSRSSAYWVDSDHVLCQVFVDKSAYTSGWGHSALRGIQTAPLRWQQWKAGERSVSVLDATNGDSQAETAPERVLLLIEVNSGRMLELTRARGRIYWKPSPNGSTIAVFKNRELPAMSAYTLAKGDDVMQHCSLEFITIASDGATIAKKVDGFFDVDAACWSSAGDELALNAYAERTAEQFVLTRIRVADCTKHEFRKDGLRPSGRVFYTSADTLLVRTTSIEQNSHSGANRNDWWLVDKSNTWRCVAAGALAIPASLEQCTSHDFIGIANGILFHLDTASSALNEVVPTFKGRIAKIVWPKFSTSTPVRKENRILVCTVDTPRQSYVIGLADNTVTPLRPPATGAEPIAFCAVTESLVFAEASRNGSRLWDFCRDQSSVLLECNLFLTNIRESEIRKIEYLGSDGSPLNAWIVLPAEYDEKRRYPLITKVYSGRVFGINKPQFLGLSDGLHSAYNIQLWAAKGYAVLLPSMPTLDGGLADDPFQRLPNGVVSAVNKVVELGIADPKRLFLFGHSNGGFSVYGLITQTNIFKAAVASAGFVDLAAHYGQGMLSNRYNDWLSVYDKSIGQIYWAELGQGGLASPPWQDSGRYFRNSPIYYANRVQTPIMLVHGDNDFVSIEQPEEFFSAMRRLNKTARFVRYWGEGHNIRSPSNIRDLTARVFAWYDDYGDILRDSNGRMIFDGETVKSRSGAPAWTPDQFQAIDRARPE